MKNINPETVNLLKNLSILIDFNKDKALDVLKKESLLLTDTSTLKNNNTA